MENKRTGYIYKITSPNTDKIYIGSTSRTLAERFKEHIKGAKTKPNDCRSSQIINIGDAKIELIKEIHFYNKSYLEQKERNQIQKYKSICVNKKFMLSDEELEQERKCTKCGEQFTRRTIWKHIKWMH